MAYDSEPVIEEQPVAAVEPVHHQPAVHHAPEPLAEHRSAPAATVSTAAPAVIGSSMLTAPVIAAAAATAASHTPVKAEAAERRSEPKFEDSAPVAAAAAPAEGCPEIDLRMRPVRAGVEGDGARVEFELTVDNIGAVPAQDVRVSTWMLAAGSSEAEQMLIAPAGQADTPPVTLAPGEARTMEASVGLPTSEVDGDAVLPVVVADVTHRLPDGTTAHATARFAVGVPDGEELAHFSIDNPSGLHEGVVARELGEMERA
jgi:Meckel syndrome type 1 protein